GEAEVLIVVSPKSIAFEWEAEFRRFTGDLYRVAVIHGDRAQRRRALTSGADVVVANYEAVVSAVESMILLARRVKAVLLLDESFLVKNPHATRTRAVADLREWC